MEALFPDGEVKLNSCAIRIESSTFIRIDKMVVQAARLQDSDHEEGMRFRMLLGRLGIPLGDFVEDLLRQVYGDRSGSVLCDRSDDYRDIVHLMVEGAYPGTLPPATQKDVNRFLAVVSQPTPYAWTQETVFPSCGMIVLPDAIVEKVGRNLERGLPPILPQWCSCRSYLFNGPWNRACTGIEYGGLDDKILAGVCNSFNTDLMGGLAQWPYEWTPDPEWVEAYMTMLDDVYHMAMPVDLNHQVDLVLDTARRLPVIMQEEHGQTYARLVNFEMTRDRAIGNVEIQETNVLGTILPPPPPGVATLNDGEPDLDAEETAEETAEVEAEEEVTPECTHCPERTDDLSACPLCGSMVCDGCWFGSCDVCGEEMCSTCYADHACAEENNDD